MATRRVLGVLGVGILLTAGASVRSGAGVAYAAPPDVGVSPTRAPRVGETPKSVASKHVARKDGPVGHLEHPGRLASLFSRLQAVESHQAQTDVRILQFGDSHTASDYGTSVARARLVSRFGDGGRGFIPMGEPYKRLFQAGEAVARGNAFEPAEASLGRRRPDYGFFGLTGIAMDGSAPGASMSSDLTASADHFEIAYLAQPGGGSFDVLVDGKRSARVTTAQPTRGSASQKIDVARGPHRLEVRAVGDGAVRVFGVRLDDDAVGVTFDALGVNGAKATLHLASDEAHLGEQIARIAPALAIVAYGTNESGDSTTLEEHAVAMRTLLARVKKPGADCLVLGPPDRDARTAAGVQTMNKLVELVAVQRRVADEAGCAFFDQFAAMGGSGAIGRWSTESPPRSRRDLVHMTRA